MLYLIYAHANLPSRWELRSRREGLVGGRSGGRQERGRPRGGCRGWLLPSLGRWQLERDSPRSERVVESVQVPVVERARGNSGRTGTNLCRVAPSGSGPSQRQSGYLFRRGAVCLVESRPEAPHANGSETSRKYHVVRRLAEVLLVRTSGRSIRAHRPQGWNDLYGPNYQRFIPNEPIAMAGSR